MVKIGRNSPCPCGSGKKYKRCCAQKEAEFRNQDLPSGRFTYKTGSYGSPSRGYMPSIMGYKDIGNDSWKEHMCLVKPDIVLEDEDSATAIAEEHLSNAKAIYSEEGSIHDFALSLRHEGYKNVTDFDVIKE